MKTEIFKLRMSPEERAAYEAEAERRNVPLSEWIRDACDEAVRTAYVKTAVRFDDAAVARLLEMLKSKDGAA